MHRIEMATVNDSIIQQVLLVVLIKIQYFIQLKCLMASRIHIGMQKQKILENKLNIVSSHA